MRCPECDKTLTADDLFGHDCEVGEPCSCPSCESGGECRKNFCAICSQELCESGTWPDFCQPCSETYEAVITLA